MRLFPMNSSKELRNGGSDHALLYLNVYDLTPVNNYLYWLGFGIFHTGIEVFSMKPVYRCFALTQNSLHVSCLASRIYDMEYAFGAHEYSTSGVFEVEPKSCPGFIFRRSIPLGSTDMSPTEFRTFMEHLSNKYHGDTYHLIAKNCNHFTNEVCMRLTGKPIPGWVNRLAKVGSYCNCLLPENIEVAAVRHLPDHATYSDGGSSSGSSSLTMGSEEEEVDHHLLTEPNSDVAFLQDRPMRLAKDAL
ncbi:deSI-like protein At4g17486 isoform X1 [Cynara cardunculus var. scolymus]|uniref:deSI-like protein At4g17486 isoform X1 n=1 Tax=Cynara cardunculus var. scolymus TaxID=59895 RepID=UPI000D62BBC5|nr:deSI-like protein At4g17486 isoform X1 [Cynara cardunculus var. scolymus]